MFKTIQFISHREYYTIIILSIRHTGEKNTQLKIKERWVKWKDFIDKNYN